jgi:hypothetical protein
MVADRLVVGSTVARGFIEILSNEAIFVLAMSTDRSLVDIAVLLV